MPPNHHSELYTEWKNMKIFGGLSNSKNMVLDMKKLLNVGVDLTQWRRGKKKLFGRNERQRLRRGGGVEIQVIWLNAKSRKVDN